MGPGVACVAAARKAVRSASVKKGILPTLTRSAGGFSLSPTILSPTTDTPRGWNEHGGELFAAGRYAEALASFERAITRSPLYVEAWINKANALYEAGQHEDALQASLRAIEVAPLFARTWLNKGAMENRMGRSALALASFREYLALGQGERRSSWRRRAAR